MTSERWAVIWLIPGFPQLAGFIGRLVRRSASGDYIIREEGTMSSIPASAVCYVELSTQEEARFVSAEIKRDVLGWIADHAELIRRQRDKTN
jgi:hypothetical protein